MNTLDRVVCDVFDGLKQSYPHQTTDWLTKRTAYSCAVSESQVTDSLKKREKPQVMSD